MPDRWLDDLTELVVPKPLWEADGWPALAIIHAQYHRELARATQGQPGERAAALAEARRLVTVAVALRGGLTSRGVAEIPAHAPDEPEPRAP